MKLLCRKFLCRNPKTFGRKFREHFYRLASAGVIGIYFFIRIVKLIDTVIHTSCYIRLITSSKHCDSVTNLLLHLANGATKNKEIEEVIRNQELQPMVQTKNSKVSRTSHFSIYSASVENEMNRKCKGICSQRNSKPCTCGCETEKEIVNMYEILLKKGISGSF